VTPKNHPLAKRRVVQPRDLKKYPMLNSLRGGFADPSIAATLDKLGVFTSHPQRVEAIYTTVIRRYVEMGFGIGLVPGLPGRVSAPHLHERSMGKYFGRVTINLIWRKGALREESIRAFADVVKEVLQR